MKPQESDLSINYAANSKNKSQDNNNRGAQVFQRGGQSNRSRGRGRLNNNSRPRCQICEKLGHTAMRCYFRFNTNFMSNQTVNT